MGKPSTGAWCDIECQRLDLRYLQKAGYIVKGARTEGTIEWNVRGAPAGSVVIHCTYTKHDSSIRLMYKIGESVYDYKIQLEVVPSNLGKGEVLYMLCPKTWQRVKVLYMAYGVKEFLSRHAYMTLYNRRIYYELQMCSQRERYNTRYWNLQGQLDKVNKLRAAKDYAGKLTRRAKRTEALHDKQEEAERMRWSRAAMTKAIAGEILKTGYIF